MGERGWDGGAMVTEFTKDIIERAFDAMGQMAAERGLEIAVYGGSCLILASDIGGASGDVDAVFLKTIRQLGITSRTVLVCRWIGSTRR